MPERGFNTDYWADTFVESLPSGGKLLYAYLWTNPHCNQAGLYEITLDRISYETKLPLEGLPTLMKALEPKVKWYPEQNLVWVKNFIKRQSKSPKFLVAAARSLSSIHNNGAVTELLEYNREKYSISIPYIYTMDSVGIPSASASVSSASSVAVKVGVVKGKGTEEEQILHSLAKLKGWQADEDDVLWLQGLRSEFPGFTLAEFKACVDYYSGKTPPKHKGIWKNRFRNWLVRKRDFERRDRSEQPRPHRQGDSREPSPARYRKSLE